MNNMQKTARGLDIVFRILSVLTILGIVFLVALNAIGIAAGYDKLVDPDNMSFTLSAGGIHIDAKDLGSAQEIGGTLLLLSGSVIISLAAVWYGIRIIRRILAPMKEGQPFSQGISGEFKKLGWFVIGYGIVYNAFDLIAKTALAARLVSSHTEYPTLGIEHHLDPTFLVIAFILFLCSYIFRYGEELQQLSDETL
ncbi:MAG: hypothetical protein K5981_09540 [Clostridia bacterium]|nr:hypothetical protein [Clostridia bacterium]